MTEPLFDIAVGIASFFAGLLGALIGLGGGIIITPLLVLLFGIDIRYAMGAALCSVIATSSGAAAAYLRDGISNTPLSGHRRPGANGPSRCIVPTAVSHRGSEGGSRLPPRGAVPTPADWP